ncbi:glycine betaine ABC transporter substrate-binding protein [Caldalkalibacillus salinus]|uniref:glycine betaine ABC transporter substrate-binding protein n=1 Tax=Caldalkalibacillus salinus TaxID=2803787 RepID=UPI001F2C31CE|nr:glycine betaine ABC transporter substrate-binding protein [Caldalkalibacillus salinus]
MTFEKRVLYLIFVIVLITTGCGMAQEDGNDQPGTGEDNPGQETDQAKPGEGQTITFGVTPWTSTVPPTYVAKNVLEDMGYTVDLQEADVGVVFTSLSQGELDVFMDAWLPDMHGNFMAQYRDQLEDVAVSYTEGELGWVLPEYVEGIQSVEDLKGREDQFEGKIYGIEEGDGLTITSRDMIEAYDLDLEYVASSESGMLAQAKRSIDAGEPVLFVGWRPHPMFADWDLRVLEDPQGFLQSSEVHVLTRQDLAQDVPEAFDFLSRWHIPVEDVEEMIVQIDEGTSPDEVAREWIEQNSDTVQEMKEGTGEEEESQKPDQKDHQDHQD